MQIGTGSLTEQGTVIAPDPARSQYDIQIPWLIAGDREQSRALDNVDMSSLSALFHHPASTDAEQRDSSVQAGSRLVESRDHPVFAQSLPGDQVVSDIVERIEKYAGISDLDNLTSRFVIKYLTERCYGRHITLGDEHILNDLKQWGSADCIARYLSRELMNILLRPTCVSVDLSSAQPFLWTHDMPLPKSNKTIFRSVAAVNDFEREFAAFLDRCEDVIRFASLAVADQRSLVVRARDGSPFPSVLPYDPDWIVVSHRNDDLRYWIASTKERPHDSQEQHQFMATEWCNIATRITGHCWRYIHVQPENPSSDFPSFHSLNVHHVVCFLTAFRAAQKVPTSLAEMLQMRDEGRRSRSSLSIFKLL